MDTAAPATETTEPAMPDSNATAETADEPGMAGGTGMADQTDKDSMAADKDGMATTDSMAADDTAHTVASGDTLWDLAKAKYGDGTQWTAIRDANPGINPRNLTIGESLKLPEM